MKPLDALVVGGGQAGLATAYHLRAAGLDYELLDAGTRIGDSWRNRYNALTLFTPRQFSALPGLALAGNREGYPTRDEFADYLEAYARRLALKVRLDARVTRLHRADDDIFEAWLAEGECIRARRVVIATGAFQLPAVPSLASGFTSSVIQLTVGTYRDPSQLPEGPVLVVGDGASGRDIAAELVRSRPTYLATGRARRHFPERILGKSAWWWMNLLGLLRLGPETFLGRRIRAADAFPDRNRSLDSLVRQGVSILPRLGGAAGCDALFEGGASARIAGVVWATGYRDDSSWVAIAGATDPSGAFLHVAGVSPVDGIYFVGRPWQHNRASALVMGAGSDAAQIVARIVVAISARQAA